MTFRKSINNSIPCLVTYTRNTYEEIIEHGGDFAWNVDPKKVEEECEYLVCTSSRQESRYTAFLIGKIAKAIKYEDGSDVSRYSIMISEYAEVEILNLWPKIRKSFTYKTLEELGIGLSTLTLLPMPDRVEPLSLGEAKQRLAKTFKVSENAIRIIIEV